MAVDRFTTVKVTLPAPRAAFGVVYAEGGKSAVQQRLAPPVLDALAGVTHGHFEGWFLRGGWILGNRLPDKNW